MNLSVPVLLSLLLIAPGIPAQVNKEGIYSNDSLKHHKDNGYRIPIGKVVVPAMFIAYGTASFAVPRLKNLDISTKGEVLFHKPKQTALDNYTQFAPALMTYGLDAMGIKAKHGLKDRTIVFLSSQLVAGAITMPGKVLIGRKRPDGSNNMSFPSGHAATAFASAHFMYREYRETNLLLSIAGYPFAVFTGAYRIINNKHWVSDVVAGAGVGILSTELAYWLLPRIKKLSSANRKASNVSLMPFYQQQGFGLSLTKGL